MPKIEEIGLSPKQEILLGQINELAKQMEHLGNSDKSHALIALLEELSNGYYIDIVYFLEKTNMLFSNCKITVEEI